MSGPTTVVCVLRSGGAYSPEDVIRLARGVRRHGGGARLICLTDVADEIREAATLERFPAGLELLPLLHDWPGWWAKLEAFRVVGPALYIDLDTVIVGDIVPLLKAAADQPENGMMMLDGFYRPERCSGIMGWSGDATATYQNFVSLAHFAKWIPRAMGIAMEVPHSGEIWQGDQNWIRENFSGPITIAQHLVDGILSYKVHVVGMKRGLPARVIAFHGRPRPFEVIDEMPSWLREVMLA